MKLALGAPVAERAWILPQWFECLSSQTLKPDDVCFVLTSGSDDTENLLQWPSDWRTYIRKTKLPFYERDIRNKDPKDPHRAKHMAKLRNELRSLFLATDADVFVSLDTDILLEDPTILEQLVSTLSEDWDVATALTYLHPLGERSQCYNAGYLGGGEGFDQVWARAEHYAALRVPPVQIDIPMAAYAIKRHAMAMCKYSAHECGEDVGFAQSLKRHKLRVAWRTDLKAQHVWNESYLGQAA